MVLLFFSVCFILSLSLRDDCLSVSHSLRARVRLLALKNLRRRSSTVQIVFPERRRRSTLSLSQNETTTTTTVTRLITLLSRDGREQHNRQRLKAVRERFKTADVVVGFTRSATVSGRLGAMPDVFESRANSNEEKVVCVSSGQTPFFFRWFSVFCFFDQNQT